MGRVVASEEIRSNFAEVQLLTGALERLISRFRADFLAPCAARYWWCFRKNRKRAASRRMS